MRSATTRRRSPPAVPADVEVLADVELDAQLVPDRPHRRRRTAEELVGVHEGEVADEDGDALAEAPRLTRPSAGLVLVGEREVRRALAAPHRGPVHHVVVEQGEGVEQLERRAGVDRALVPLVAPGGDEPPVAEGRAQALAAGQEQRRHRVERRGEVGVEVGPPPALDVEQHPQPRLDPARDRGERGRRDGHALHARRAAPRRARSRPVRCRSLHAEENEGDARTGQLERAGAPGARRRPSARRRSR